MDSLSLKATGQAQKEKPPDSTGGSRGQSKLLMLQAAFFLALVAAAVTAAMFASASSVACLAAFVMLSYAELAAAIADFTAAIATSEPAGAFFANLSR